MTREERENALHCLKVMIDEEVCEECNLYGTTGTDHCEADCVRVAIKALQEHQHYKDLAESYEKTINKLTKAIAEPQQKIGHWTHDGGYWKNRWICSECGYKLYDEQSKYCPDCGSYNGGARGDIPLQQSVPKMPQPKTGHWIEHKHGGIEHIECSECGVWFLKADLIRKSYCPNCGSCNGDMIKNIMRDITKTMSGGTK